MLPLRKRPPERLFTSSSDFGGVVSRFGEFLRDYDLKQSAIADVTGVSRQHVARLRYGTCEPTRAVMIWLTVAARRLLHRRIKITQLFDLGGTERYAVRSALSGNVRPFSIGLQKGNFESFSRRGL